jgi:hypothetical protein
MDIVFGESFGAQLARRLGGVVESVESGGNDQGHCALHRESFPCGQQLPCPFQAWELL